MSIQVKSLQIYLAWLLWLVTFSALTCSVLSDQNGDSSVILRRTKRAAVEKRAALFGILTAAGVIEADECTTALW